MGNSGSIHNLNVESVSGELNSYLQSQNPHLRRNLNRNVGQNAHYKGNASSLQRTQPTRYTTEWRKSIPNNDINEYGNRENQFKVLPKLDDRLQLRATTNGAILHSGGTISGRKDAKQSETGQVPVASAMQRSRTFIFEPTKEDNSAKELNPNDQTIPQSFARSQTLLHIKSRIDKPTTSQQLPLQKPIKNSSNLKSMQRHTNSEPDFYKDSTIEKNRIKQDHLETLAKPSKLNKYVKKRRAPPAPTTLSAISTEKEVPKPSLHLAHNQKSTKQQLFTKNCERGKSEALDGIEVVFTNKTRSAEINNSLATRQNFEYGSALRRSSNLNKPTVNTKLNVSNQTKIPFRREKSSDAILSRRQTEKSEENKVGLKRDIHVSSLQKFLKTDVISSLKKENVQHFSSKIPQLKRTFYFGMDNISGENINRKTTVNPVHKVQDVYRCVSGASANSPENITPIQLNNLDVGSLAEMPNIPSYDINIDNKDGLEDINDNGIKVRLRPTLPRKQLDIPSFSPSLAWRMLVEEQENLQHERKMRLDSSDENMFAQIVKEAPIRPARMSNSYQMKKLMPPLSKTWTPEQDLGDDDDAETPLDVQNDSSSDEYTSKIDSDEVLFYGSKSKNETQNVNNEVSPVHLFSLSLPRDAHVQGYMENIASEKAHIYNSLQKPKPAYLSNQSTSQSPIACRNSDTKFELNTLPVSKFDISNNWVLHRNMGDLSSVKRQVEPTEDKQGFSSIEPLSLKFLTGGKHAIYLPGNLDRSENGTIQTEIAPIQSAEQRHLKRRQRENLQDVTPLFPTMEDKSQNFLSNTFSQEEKPFHQRFTFQSTVRLLEKRRLADKLSRDAAIKEAQRKSEMEAIKRVEEDFQRKRANEKANIRYQLQLYFGGNNECKERYHSLPYQTTNANTFSLDHDTFNINDTNNNNLNRNMCCRDEPDGCVASPQLTNTDKGL